MSLTVVILLSWSTPRRNTEGYHSRSRVYSLSLWWWVLFKWLPLSNLDLMITVLLCHLVWFYFLLLSCKKRLLSSQPMLNFCFCDDKTVIRISKLASLMRCQSMGGGFPVFVSPKNECKLDEFRFPDKFVRPGVNKEFQWVNFSSYHQTIVNFL